MAISACKLLAVCAYKCPVKLQCTSVKVWVCLTKIHKDLAAHLSSLSLSLCPWRWIFAACRLVSGVIVHCISAVNSGGVATRFWWSFCCKDNAMMEGVTVQLVIDDGIQYPMIYGIIHMCENSRSLNIRQLFPTPPDLRTRLHIMLLLLATSTCASIINNFTCCRIVSLYVRCRPVGSIFWVVRPLAKAVWVVVIRPRKARKKFSPSIFSCLDWFS